MSEGNNQQAALQRSLGLGSAVLTGVAYMVPMIVLGTYGVVAQASAGTVPSAYVLALIAMLFTAYSYGRMAAAYRRDPRHHAEPLLLIRRLRRESGQLLLLHAVVVGWTAGFGKLS